MRSDSGQGTVDHGLISVDAGSRIGMQLADHWFEVQHNRLPVLRYVPRNDLYIEKETDINEEIERLRLAASTSLLSRSDTIVVASDSCIYGLGNAEAYGRVVIELESGKVYRREALLRRLVEAHYERKESDLMPGAFRVRGETLEVVPASIFVVVSTTGSNTLIREVTKVWNA